MDVRPNLVSQYRVKKLGTLSRNLETEKKTSETGESIVKGYSHKWVKSDLFFLSDLYYDD